MATNNSINNNVPSLFTLSAGQVIARTATAISYTVLVTDYYVGVTDTSAARTMSLPNAPTTNQVFVIKDESGAASVNNISITTVGGAVLLDGLTTIKISQNYGAVKVIFNGTSYFTM
jgi:Flp pilus assembly pilin Flp